MKIIIVGGGCSGVIAAIKAKNKNNEVIILERNNTLLKKLLLTGNGRCNYFNENYSIDNYHSNNIDLVNEFISNDNIIMAKEFFDNLGIVPKVKNGYYYPDSNQAISIKDILVNEINRLGIKVIYDTYVEEIIKKDKFIIKTNNKEYECDKLILSTGSFAYPKTGSDGKGYSILEKLGHTIIEPVPALVQLNANSKYLKDWDGVRSDVYLELFEDGKYLSKEEGEIQFTKYGLSGICIFNLSHYISRGLLENKKYVVKINFVPFIKTLISPWLYEYSKKNKEKDIYCLLEGFINKKLIPIILKESNINRNKKYDDLTKEEKIKLINSLRHFKVEITSTKGFDSSQVCNGGVSLEEININTMESKIVKDLYIIGELLDINGNCGGYNLTECWISGILSGKDIGGNNA